MRIIETFEDSPKGEGKSEDRLVVTDDFAAVLDGAGGSAAAETVAGLIRRVDADIDAAGFVALATEALTPLAARWDGKGYRVASQAVVYSRTRREVWRVGDCHFRINRLNYLGTKKVDELLIAYRCAMLEGMVRAGMIGPWDILDEAAMAQRPWRAIIEVQGQFQNRDTGHELEYGILDGTPVPPRFVEAYKVSPGSRVVLCSDGFLAPASNLGKARQELADTAALDPCMFRLVKGSRPFIKGTGLFDDATYVRLLTN